MFRRHIDTAHQQVLIHDPVKEFRHPLEDLPGRRGIAVQIPGTVGMFGDFSSVRIRSNFSPVLLLPFRIFQIIHIIPYRQYDLVGDKSLIQQIQGQHICHFPDCQPCLAKGIRTVEHLAGSHTAALRLVSLDVLNGTGFPAPGVIYKKLCIDSEKIIQKILIVIVPVSSKGTAGNVSHSIQSMGLQLFGIAFSHPPEICQGPVGPEKLSIGHLI